MNIIVAGDFAPYSRISSLIEKGNVKDIIDVRIQDEINRSDYSIVNLEAPIIESGYASIPYKINLGTPKFSLDFLKTIGFKCVTLANNHIRDYLDKGVVNSLKLVDEYDMDRVGAGENLYNAQSILYKQIGDRNLAIVNICENEFSIANTRPGAAPLDMIDNYHQIVEAKNKADYVLVIVHGGHEHYQLPSPRMKKTYEWFVELGADAVVNHHQHCFTGYEIYRSKPIFYGIGNFCFDWPGRTGTNWNQGFLVNLTFKENVSFKLIPYCQCDVEPKVRWLTNEELASFNQTIEGLNEIINDNEEVEHQFEKYCRTRFMGMALAITPYSSRISKGLFMRKLLPSFITDKRRFVLFDYVNCEAHRDVLINYLR